MRILLDECLPRGLVARLQGHVVATVPQAGWASFKNGRLLRRIADSQKYDIFLTVDKNLPGQNRSGSLPFAIVVLRAKSNPLGAYPSVWAGDSLQNIQFRAGSRLYVDESRLGGRFPYALPF